MHKTMLAALIVGASALSVPAFAQVNLGGAAQVGAGATTGAVVPHAMQPINQTRAQTAQTQHRADRQTKRMTHTTAGRTRSAIDHNGHANAGIAMGDSIDASTGSTHPSATTGARVDAGVDAGSAADQADQTGQRIGHQASDTTHAAMQTTDRAAGSTGNTVNQTRSGQAVDADANVRVEAAAHGH